MEKNRELVSALDKYPRVVLCVEGGFVKQFLR